MKNLLLVILFFVSVFTIGSYFTSKIEPYEEGMHWDYSITCEGGFVYKSLSNNRGTIQILNSDGTPLKCGKKRY